MQRILSGFSLLLSFSALGLIAGAASAQNFVQVQSTPAILLELNSAATTQAGGCRLTYVANNGSDQALQQIAYQVVIFDGDGIVRRILVLEFGGLTVGKTKIVQFELGDQGCDDISRIVVNDVAECTLAEGGAADFCLSGLETNSRTPIQFGI